MTKEIPHEDLKLLTEWKEVDGLTHNRIAKRYNKMKMHKVNSCLSHNDIKKALRGITSIHHENLKQAAEKKKAKFWAQFDEG